MKLILVVAAITWASLIAYLLLVPTIPASWLDVSDTTAHGLAFFGLAVPIWGLVLGKVSITRGVVALAAMLSFGIAVEIGQSVSTDVRQAQVSDVWADLFGIVVGAVAVGLVFRLSGRSLEPTKLVLAVGSWLSILLLGLSFAFAGTRAENLDLCPDFEVVSRGAPGGPAGRATDGLLALYHFGQHGGTDLSGVQPELPLVMTGATPTDEGLQFGGGTEVARAEEAFKLNCSMAMAGEFTIDVWFTSSNLSQSGPTRIVGLSSGTAPADTNIRIGQERDGLDLRFTVDGTVTSTTVDEQIVEGALTHTALRLGNGQADLFVDGTEVWSESFGGDISIWDVTTPLLIGNESTGDRGFVGTISLVALYDRALSNEELAINGAIEP